MKSSTVATVFILAFALVLIVFTLQNTESVTLRFLVWQFTNIPLVLALFGVFAAGVIGGAIIRVPKIRRIKRELKEVRQELEKLATAEKEDDVTSEGISMGKQLGNGFFSDEE
jgi:uncharacterized integral membrane protein